MENWHDFSNSHCQREREREREREKAADLPVQTPNKYELAINLKTAKSLEVYKRRVS